MEFRDYQMAALNSIFTQWESVRSTLLDSAVGTGKTVMFSEVCRRRLPSRALVICNQRELVGQAKATLERVLGAPCGVEMGDLHVSPSQFKVMPAIVATVQTLIARSGGKPRMMRWQPTDFDTLVVDECDLAAAPSFRRVIAWFSQNPKLKILGVTATPYRHSGGTLIGPGQLFDTVAYSYPILEGIRDGWLVPICQQYVPVAGLDYSTVRTQLGDLHGADLARVLEDEHNLQLMVQPSLEVIYRLPIKTLSAINPAEWGSYLQGLNVKPRRALAFTVSVKQAEMLCDIFNRVIDGLACFINGKTDKDERLETTNNFKAGTHTIVCNVGIFTRGYDDAGVEVIIGGRPTKSLVLMTQIIGRGTRPLPGTVDGLKTAEERRAAIAASGKVLTVLDFVGNSGKHKLKGVADILGDGRNTGDAIARVKARVLKTGKAVRVDVALDEEQNKIKAEAEARKLRERARKEKLLFKANFTSKTIDIFDALDIHRIEQKSYTNGKRISEKESNLLIRQGVNPDTLDYYDAKALLRELFRRWRNKLCTPGQARVLKRHGYETKDMSFDSAKKLLDTLANNGWKKISNPELVTP